MNAAGDMFAVQLALLDVGEPTSASADDDAYRCPICRRHDAACICFDCETSETENDL